MKQRYSRKHDGGVKNRCMETDSHISELVIDKLISAEHSEKHCDYDQCVINRPLNKARLAAKHLSYVSMSLNDMNNSKVYNAEYRHE